GEWLTTRGATGRTRSARLLNDFHQAFRARVLARVEVLRLTRGVVARALAKSDRNVPIAKVDRVSGLRPVCAEHGASARNRHRRPELSNILEQRAARIVKLDRKRHEGFLVDVKNSATVTIATAESRQTRHFDHINVSEFPLAQTRFWPGQYAFARWRIIISRQLTRTSTQFERARQRVHQSKDLLVAHVLYIELLRESRWAERGIFPGEVAVPQGRTSSRIRRSNRSA